ncbi:MAG TPA: permease-like cell division protein FtsX [Kofleriaceae bacterium]|nr:permease-like cell division protein FtsX [Kofleriaceae bacterium]
MIHRARAALGRAAELATRRPRAALWSLLALACALFVIGLAAIGAATVDRWAAAHPGSGGSMVIYLGDGVDPARAGELVSALRAQGGVERAELISAAESARRLTRALGSDPALLDGVDLASLPASVEVALAPGVRDVVAMSPTVRALRGAPGVAEVVVDDDQEDRIAAVLHAARAFAWPAAAVLAGIALVIALAAVRVRLDRSAREAAVLHLLGAPPGFAAIPSALAGALHGAVAAGIAALALGLVVRGAAGSGEPGAWGSIALGASPVLAIAGLIGFGALVGLIGGGLAGVARAR